jgi:prolyl oligopeptidase
VQGAAEIPLASYLVDRVNGIAALQVSSERILGRFVTVHDGEALWRTNALGDGRGNNFGIIGVELASPFRRRVVVPEDDQLVLLRAQRIGPVLVLQYITRQLTNVVRFVDLGGRVVGEWRPADAELPDHGTLSPFTGDQRSRRAYFTYSSIAMPTQTFAVDLEDGPRVTALRQAWNVPFDASKVRYELREYQSDDGCRIPIQVMTRSDSTAGPAFAYLHCYGAIGIPAFTEWNGTFQIALELGGMVAIANIRGGGEFGVEWQFPTKLDRRRTLEDIAAASRWLKSQYLSIGTRVGLSGGSFGGLHTLASMVRFPDEFGLFVPAMAVSDVVRFLQNGRFGRYAWDDFGLPHDASGNLVVTRKDIETLKSWSPMQNLAKLEAPLKPTLLVTADGDERVEPDHAYAMVDALQARFGMDAPVYLWVEPNSGHYALTGVDELTFIAKQFGIRTLEPLLPGQRH